MEKRLKCRLLLTAVVNLITTVLEGRLSDVGVIVQARIFLSVTLFSMYMILFEEVREIRAARERRRSSAQHYPGPNTDSRMLQKHPGLAVSTNQLQTGQPHDQVPIHMLSTALASSSTSSALQGQLRETVFSQMGGGQGARDGQDPQGNLNDNLEGAGDVYH